MKKVTLFLFEKYNSLSDLYEWDIYDTYPNTNKDVAHSFYIDTTSKQFYI